jgi:uncharacterized OB-fold protein
MPGERIPVVEGLFTEDDGGARLLGSRCAACGTPYFPRSDRCRHPDCSGTQIEDAVFGPFGTLWSYSVQNYPPPAPASYDEPYHPYALAVVDLADGLRVVGRLIDDASTLRIGAPVELVLAPLCHEDDGSALITWMFRTR